MEDRFSVSSPVGFYLLYFHMVFFVAFMVFCVYQLRMFNLYFALPFIGVALFNIFWMLKAVRVTVEEDKVMIKTLWGKVMTFNRQSVAKINCSFFRGFATIEFETGEKYRFPPIWMHLWKMDYEKYTLDRIKGVE